MTAIRDVARQELLFRSRALWGQDWDLWAGDDRIGIIQRPKTLGALTELLLDDGRWTVRRGGTLRRMLTICRDNGDDVAMVQLGWPGLGDVFVADTIAYRFTRASMWRGTSAAVAAAGNRVITLQPQWTFDVNKRLAVTVAPPAIDSPDLPWLVMLGGFLSMLAVDDVMI